MKVSKFIVKHLIISFRYLSTHKIVNGLKLISSYLFSFPKVEKLSKISPFFISVETSNFCNLHCPECPVGTGKNPKEDKSTFDIDLYKNLIDELKSNLLHVILYFQGEPFLSHHLFEMIRYTHEARIYTSTSTNGQFLSEKVAREIVISGLDKLIVSIDGSTQEVYETYRKGGSLQKIKDGINHIVEWKKELNSVTPLIEIQFLVLKTNEHQLKDMKIMARSLQADRLVFKTAQLYDFENGNELLTSINRFARYKKGEDGKYSLKGKPSNRCWRMWSGAVVNVHGEVLPCCFDKSSEHSFGNITGTSFSNCWQSEKASTFRSNILKDRRQFEMCRNCTSR